MEKQTLFHIENLSRYYKTNRGNLRAVDNVSFDIYEGETLGLVGESGCGKTTCGRTLIGLYTQTYGTVYYRGKNVHTLKGNEKKSFNKDIQMVFQDAYSSLDPRMTVGDIIAEGIEIHHLAGSKKERDEQVCHYLELVGLGAEHRSRYAHEFSGGQRQRIGIARALAVQPSFILLDEPISALDVSIQAQIVNLLMELQKKLGLTYMFVAHDLSMVRIVSDRVAVMYLGNLVELASSDEIYYNPLHPYTKALYSSVPIPDPELESQRLSEKIVLPDLIDSGPRTEEGCKFANRCGYCTKKCTESSPALRDDGSGHFAACHNPLSNEGVSVRDRQIVF
ncbi:MAG: ATP-binding cassette domain-containing protein [Treponema sp.]|jgi:oligopeptide transport system ATP-binding protein|nr:ATP-binding cassette domain-containing protein [Treponema sp.]